MTSFGVVSTLRPLAGRTGTTDGVSLLVMSAGQRATPNTYGVSWAPGDED